MSANSTGTIAETGDQSLVASKPCKRTQRIFLPSSALVAMLIAATCLSCVAWRMSLEADYRRTPQRLAAFPVISSLEDYLWSSQTGPDIVLLGSSLSKNPIYYADLQFTGRSAPKDPIPEALDRRNHNKSRFWSHLVKQRLSGEFTTWCFGSAGASIADDHIAFRKILEFGKRPTLVVVAAGLRDFCCGNQQNAALSATHQRLSDLHPPDKCFQTFPALIAFVRELWPVSRHLVGLSCELSWYRDLYIQKLTRSASLWLNLPGTEQRTQTARSRTDRKFQCAATISEQRKSYERGAVNYAYQAAELHSLVTLAEKEHIPVLIITMPVSAAHLSAIPPGLMDEFQRTLQVLAKHDNVKVVDEFNTPAYTDGDFSDSMHLFGPGGAKFIQRVVNALPGDPWTRQWLQQAHSAPLANRGRFQVKTEHLPFSRRHPHALVSRYPRREIASAIEGN